MNKGTYVICEISKEDGFVELWNMKTYSYSGAKKALKEINQRLKNSNTEGFNLQIVDDDKYNIIDRAIGQC